MPTPSPSQAGGFGVAKAAPIFFLPPARVECQPPLSEQPPTKPDRASVIFFCNASGESGHRVCQPRNFLAISSARANPISERGDPFAGTYTMTGMVRTSH